MFGTQWYILFNVIAGASAFPNDLKEAVVELPHSRLGLVDKASSFPAIFPFYVTGAITASGGSWNAAIVAEYAKWGDETVAGARHRRLYRQGDRRRRLSARSCSASR